MTRRRPLSLTTPALALIGFTLAIIGILFVHSTTARPLESFPGELARAQALKLLVAVAGFVVVSRLDYRLLQRLAYPFYAVVFALLLALLVMRSTSSARPPRWIELPLFNVQPSEMMKVAVILCLACYLRFRDSQRRLSGLVVPYLMVFVPMVLVALQPDLGTSLMFPPVLLALLFVSGARPLPLMLTLGAGVSALPAAYYLRGLVPVLHVYQLERFKAYFRQWDPAVLQDEAYQLHQSLIALGSGGIHGKGWTRGTQNALDLVPEKHTDFIFSIIGEEWGFVGAAGVVVLYAVLVGLCLRVATVTREPFGRLVAAGVGTAFAVQSLQNLGMTMGLTPITGLPLPFVSFGGSSLVSSFVALGFVVSIGRRPVRVVA
ncbi:MAG: FtsW/RodA/SpoVE family cell cycle protein, partial [Planctomycetota bacterium]|nr:FtsW/RodA/SpoVE family cell cycle protein [Planctomycetota bacterium]